MQENLLKGYLVIVKDDQDAKMGFENTLLRLVTIIVRGLRIFAAIGDPLMKHWNCRKVKWVSPDRQSATNQINYTHLGVIFSMYVTLKTLSSSALFRHAPKRRENIWLSEGT